LRQAEEKLAAMWRLWGDKKNENFLAHLCLDYGKLLYERNCLNDAESFVQRAFDIAVSVRNPHLSVDAAIDLVRIYTAKGWTERAEQLIASVESWYGNDRYPVLAEKLRWFRVERDKREGKLTPATLAESECRLRYNDELPPAMLEQYDLLACLLAVQGRVAEAALLTERLLSLARREGRYRDTIRLLIHKSLFLAQQGDLAHGLETLEEALREAEPDHYIRTFVDEGMPLMQLLKTYVQMRQGKRRRGVGSISLAYVQQILHVMDRQMTDITAMEGVHLVLTPREQATLQLISRGMSNRDIAVQLKISLPTVKTHINHLYRKLQVNNRSDAVRRARFYNLI
jgi:LuxR family maltose regulon positive regulatory protein